MEPIIIASIIISVASGIVGSSIYYRRKAVIQRRIRQAPFKRIEHVEDGDVVTIAGNVVYYKRYVKAPLTGRECVYYHATVERKKSTGKSSEWVKEIDEASCVDFLLDDGVHKAIVEANAIEGYLDMDQKFRSGSFRDPTDFMQNFLDKYNYKGTVLLGINKTLRYKEGALEKHEYVIVCGHCSWEDASQYELEGLDKVLVIRSTKEHPLYISDVADMLIK